MSVSASAISRVTGVRVSYKNFNAGAAQMLSQRLAVIGVGNHGVTYGTEKYECEGTAAEIGERYGYGSPLHLAARQLFPATGKSASFPVTFYPLAEADSAVQATGSIGCTGTATELGSGTVVIGGVKAQFAVSKGAAAAVVLASVKDAINSVLEMPVIAGEISDGELTITAKAAGTVGNNIQLAVVANVAGLVFSTSEMENGAIDPDINTALVKVGEVWETAFLCCFNYNDAEKLEKAFVFVEDRWSDLVKKPCLFFWGCNDGYAARTAVTDIRPTDYANVLVTSVASPELPWVIVARAMVNDILTTADSNPACGYKGQLTGLAAGPDSLQENYTTRNNSVAKGASTNIKVGTVAELNDIITFYHPTSEGKFPSRRYVVDIMKIMNIVYNMRLILESDEKKGAPLVEDNTVTSNPAAIQPKMVKSELLNLAKTLADKAIIQDTEFTKDGLKADIDSENPKRLNVTFPVKLSGNAEVISGDIYYGFYLGGN